MIHAMAEYIFYEGRIHHYVELLDELNRGVHFAVLPDGQAVQHADPHTLLWHAAGANMESVGVELLVPGVYDLGGLYTKIHSKWQYPKAQYIGLLNIMSFLDDTGYLIGKHATPNGQKFSWDYHSTQSRGRKKDPGSSFNQHIWMNMLEGRFDGK